jgi:acyl carrier protein
MSERESIRQALIQILENDTGQSYPNLEETANLREGLGLDSVDVVSLVSQIERHYRIRLTQQELEKLLTVGDLLNLLESKLASPPQNTAAA